MTLHLPTLVFILVTGFGLLTLQLGLAGRGALGRGALQPLSWAALAFCLGFGCHALRPWLPQSAVLLAGNWLLIAGLAGLAAAVWRHLLNRGLPAWYHGLVVGALLLAPAVLDVVTPVRAGLVSTALGLLLLPATVAALREQGVLSTGLYQLRLVTHLDVNDEQIDLAVAALRRALH